MRSYCPVTLAPCPAEQTYFRLHLKMNAANKNITYIFTLLLYLYAICVHQHCHETKFRCCKLKQHVAASWTGVYFFQQICSTCNNKFCCVTMFEVGGNTCNNAFQLATQQCCVQVAAICCSYYFTLSVPFHLAPPLRNRFQIDAVKVTVSAHILSPVSCKRDG